MPQKVYHRRINCGNPSCMSCLLSVNVNKFATLRNSRGGNNPDVLRVVTDLVDWGVKGITVHPRPDERHIRKTDVYEIAEFLKSHDDVEFNIEGYPSEEFLQMIEQVRPAQCTMVPDPPDALTSNAGWKLGDNEQTLTEICQRLRKASVRSSLFVDPHVMSAEEATALGRILPDRIELYTESFAVSFKGSSELEDTIAEYQKTAEIAEKLGIQVNAGHDLDTENLGRLLADIPQIIEVSIGHALVCEALYIGLKSTIGKYNEVLQSVEWNGPGL